MSERQLVGGSYEVSLLLLLKAVGLAVAAKQLLL